MGFPGVTSHKEPAANAADISDMGSILGEGRSPGEEIGYPFQYSCASVVAQLVKNPHAMWETWVPSLGWEDPLKRGKPTHSSILAWVTKSQTRLREFHFQLFPAWFILVSKNARVSEKRQKYI